MKHMKTITIPAKGPEVKEVLAFVACDLCGVQIDESPGNYGVDEVEIRHKTGKSYPEGGNGVETAVDMCGKCFDEKLVPWLKTQGAEARTAEWYW